MEPKKIKKLVLNKETITSLSDSEKSNLKGGADDSVMILSLAYYAGGFVCKGVHYCPAGYEDDGYKAPNTNINDCPNHSQVGSGCDAETCGWAWTCNGR